MVRYSMKTSGVFLLVGAHMQASRCPRVGLVYIPRQGDAIPGFKLM